MATLTDWFYQSEKYEFCRSYGIPAEGEFVDRQEDYYIALLGVLHDILKEYFETDSTEKYSILKHYLLSIVKGLLLYSQKETADAFHGVRQLNNQLYVAAVYYLCDYAAVASWVMSDIQMDAYEDESAQLLSFIITGGKSAIDKDIKAQYFPVYKLVERFIVSGSTESLEEVVLSYNKKYEERDFDSPTDFYMTSVLRCVLKKFQRDNLWQSLRKVDVEFEWAPYVRYSYRHHILSFLPSQQDAIDKGLLDFSGAFSLKMPTSAGKSHITELLIYHELKSNPQARVLYLAPLRSLSRELREKFWIIRKELGFTFATKDGGGAVSILEDNLDNAQVLVATPESFMSIESFSQDTLDSFTLVICDEGQLLEDKGRGINYEMLLSRLRQRNKARFLFISAIIPNIKVVNRWLRGDDLHIGDSTYRPSKLILAEAVVDEDEINLNVYDRTYSKVSYTINSFIKKKDAQNCALREYNAGQERFRLKANPVGCTLALRCLSAGSVLLFATGKTNGISCKGLTMHLLGMLEKGSFDMPINYVHDKEALGNIIEYISYQLGEEHLLCKSLINGFAYHHGDVPQDIRETIERAYNNNVIRLIISNTTLAEGVNLPIKTIVLAGVIDPSSTAAKTVKYLPNTRLKNIVGRVGRAGRERYGTVLAPTTYPNGMLTKLLKQALSEDDSSLEKMRGRLFVMVEDLVNRKMVQDETNIDELLSVASFTDAIDEMIIRSASGDVNEMDMDSLVSESLAYTLSDEKEKSILRGVFYRRHHYLKENFEDERYALSKATRLNLRELDAFEDYLKDESAELSTKFELLENDDAFLSMMLNAVFILPTIQEDISSSSSTRKKLLSDYERVKRVATMWMNGSQYFEMAEKEKVEVDKIILIVQFLQGLVHDKAASIIAYMSVAKGFDISMATFWPEYLRLGINNRLMYDAHVLRVPERIQLWAINAYFKTKGLADRDGNYLDYLLVLNKKSIKQFMIDKGYPRLSISGLMEVIEIVEHRNNDAFNSTDVV